tara:strand:+ start:254 stop:457 length:204 start_codon:yes stop_codon:yes gene_type:complete
MSKCIDHPRMVFKGTLSHEGHSVTFNIEDDYVEVTNTNGAMISVSKMDIDRAIKEQEDLLKWGYEWI